MEWGQIGRREWNMPAWKVFDEETASELRSRVSGDPEVIVNQGRAALDGGDAVILAPTKHRGVTMLITARRKSAGVIEPTAEIPVEQAETFSPVYEPLFEEAVPAEHFESTPPAEKSADETQEFTPLTGPVVQDESEEEFFGPTSWERMEDSSLPEQEAKFPAATDSADEEVVGNFEPTASLEIAPDAQVAAPPYGEDFAIREEAAPPVQKVASERHYVATGFLGLDETVEDEEDLAREKRPWWKKIFLD
jgi:hypothetical protein